MLAAGVAIAASRAQAGEVRVPLTIDYLTLTEAIRDQIYTAPGGRAPLWNGGDECQFLYADNPAFSRADARVRLETAASLGLGVAVAGRCMSPVAWSGIVEAESAPYIAGGVRLMLRIEDMNLYDAHHQKTLIAGKGFDLIKQYLIPRVETFAYDLNPALEQLASLAEAASTPSVADRIRKAMTTLRAEPQVGVTNDGVKITLAIVVPDVPIEAPAAPVEPTPQEMEAFQKQLDNWDAFLVFAIKQLGGAVGDRQFRAELLQILLSSRYRLREALSKPPSQSGPDPVRVLFIDTWQKLGVAVRSGARRGQLGSRSLEFLSFISAGDALFALDEAAPALGMRISAEDLRRLAHIMAPRSAEDPLQFNFAEDPVLRKLLRPDQVEPLSSGDEEPSAVPSPTPTQAPSASPAPSPSAGARTSGWGLPWSLIEPASACAAETPGIVPQLREIAARLRRVVVDEGNAPRYRGDMDRLLDLSVQRQLRSDDLEGLHQADFGMLVKSVAWQESCWRQFVRKGDRVTWLESSTGDIGLMQVNKYVWRGFYDLEKLKWDVLYNAGAGTEILMDMAERVLGRRGARVLDGVALARSVYAAYNGGPDAYNRWRRAHEPSPAREIDAAFLEKYRAVQRGQAIDILSCAAQWGHGPGH